MPSGSSPLTRGKLEIIPHVRIVVGLIPAHAGKTRFQCEGRAPRQAHPRSRGENHEVATNSDLTHGSSPLTRGKLQGIRIAFARDRLIPAHAGKTSLKGRGTPDQWAHPRSRGENVTGD